MKTLIIKTPILYFTFFVQLLLFVSCGTELQNELYFDYKIATPGIQAIGDTLILRKSVSLKFVLSGNYDFLSFYSGETGHEFAKRNAKTYAVDEIKTSVLSFGAMPQYGTIPGTLRVFMSDSFKGLKLYDSKLDSAAVVTHNWVEITGQCNLPSTSTQVLQTSLSFIDYCDKDISLAFLYKTNQNTTSQPTWEIKDLKITNTLKNGTVSIIKAVDLGFSALDLYNLNGQTTTNGVWNLTNIALITNPVMRIQSSPVGAALNEDWLISTPSKINRRLPDTAVAIGDISTNADTFIYKYNSVGLYNITFLAQKANFKNNSSCVKTLIVRVID